jgi:hypothetical protein
LPAAWAAACFRGKFFFDSIGPAADFLEFKSLFNGGVFDKSNVIV